MILLSLLAYILFFVLVFFILKGSREQQLIALIFVNIFFYINVTLIVKPELTPFQLLPYLFFAKELLFNFHEFKKNIQEFPIKFGVLIIFAAYFVTTYTNGGGGHDYYEVFRYCFDKYLPMFAVFICAKEVEEQRIVRILFTFFLIYFGFGLVEYLLNHNYIREAIATAFPSTKAKDMFGPAGITNGFGTSSWRTRISITTKHPTVLGALLSTMFLFSLSYFKDAKEKFNIHREKVVLAALLITILLSGSRTSMGCAFLGCVIYFTNSLSFRKKLLAIITYAVLAVSLSSYAISSFSSKEGGSSLDLRQQQLLFTLVEFASKPLFGHGLYYTNHSILANAGESGNMYYSKEETQGLESIIFYTLLDIGLFGAFALIVFYGEIFFTFFSRRKEHPRLAMQGLLETSLLVVFLILSGEIGRNTEMCILFIGMSLGFLHKELEEAKATEADPALLEQSEDFENE